VLTDPHWNLGSIGRKGIADGIAEGRNASTPTININWMTSKPQHGSYSHDGSPMFPDLSIVLVFVRAFGGRLSMKWAQCQVKFVA